MYLPLTFLLVGGTSEKDAARHNGMLQDAKPQAGI